MVVKIMPNDKGTPTGKLADAELHFTDGEMQGLRLLGFAVWERRTGVGRMGWVPGWLRPTDAVDVLHAVMLNTAASNISGS